MSLKMCVAGVLEPPRAVDSIDALLQTDSQSHQLDIKEFKPLPHSASGPAFHATLNQSHASSDSKLLNKSVMRDFSGWDFAGGGARTTAGSTESNLKSLVSSETKSEVKLECLEVKQEGEEEGARWRHYTRLPPDCPLIPLGQSTRSVARSASLTPVVTPAAKVLVQGSSSPREAEISGGSEGWQPPPPVNPDLLLSMPEFV